MDYEGAENQDGPADIDTQKSEQKFDVNKMMQMMMECLVSMKNMQHDNQRMNQQILELSKERMNVSTVVEETVSEKTKFAGRIKPTRPKIEAGMDEIDWKILLDDWVRYKRRSELKDEEQICLELRDSCSNDVNKLLYQFVGSNELNASDLTEIKLLEYIRNVAVKVDHKEVHRLNFSRLKQTDGELASKYVGRLKVKASLCDFTVKCRCGEDVSYAGDMVSQQLVSGLANPEHQAKVISEAKNLPTLEKKIEKVMSLEAADEAADKIRQPSKVAAARTSLYRKGKLQNNNGKDEERPKGNVVKRSFKDRSSFRRRTPRCRGCGKSSHGPDKKMFRHDCPAYGQKCSSCGYEDHFASVCEKRRSAANFVRYEDDTPAGETSDEEREYDDEEFSDDDADAAEESMHLSTTMKDFRFATKPEPQR